MRHRSMSSHGGVVAEASPYLGSMRPVTMPQGNPGEREPPLCAGRARLTGGAAWSGFDAEQIHRRLDEAPCALGIALLEAPLHGVQRPTDAGDHRFCLGWV